MSRETMSAMTYTLAQVHSFLLGEAPLDGVWFGEKPKHGAPYFWRNHLRKAIDANLSDKAGPRVDGWLPIESAPKDGRKMILLLTPSRFPQVAFSNTWWTAGFSVENKPNHYLPIPELPEQS